MNVNRYCYEIEVVTNLARCRRSCIQMEPAMTPRRTPAAVPDWERHSMLVDSRSTPCSKPLNSMRRALAWRQRFMGELLATCGPRRRCLPWKHWWRQFPGRPARCRSMTSQARWAPPWPGWAGQSGFACGDGRCVLVWGSRGGRCGVAQSWRRFSGRSNIVIIAHEMPRGGEQRVHLGLLDSVMHQQHFNEPWTFSFHDHENTHVFIDDITVFSSTLEEHYQHLEKRFKKLRDETFYAKQSKCSFAQPEIEFCGYIAGQNGVRTQPKNIQLIYVWELQQNAQDIRRFSGLTGCYQTFIKH